MSRVAKQVRFLTRLFFGSRGARNSMRQSLDQAQSAENGVKALFSGDSHGENPGASDAERPIFVLSAGWRSGSTLLQRLVSSGGHVLLWGEAYDRSNLVPFLTRSVAPFSTAWPPAGYMVPPEDLNSLGTTWTANLYPPPAALRAAYRAFFRELFAEPARQAGAERWGFKDVRLGYAEAMFLKAVFPEGRFLFIRRNLEDAYLSYRSFSGAMDWYAAWPDSTVFTPFSFARNWARLSRETERAARDTGGLMIEYEDLVGGKVDLALLAEYCGVTVDGDILARRVGSGHKSGPAPRLTGIERILLRLGRSAA